MARIRKPGKHILTGDKEIDAKLERMKISVANKAVRKGFTKGLRITVKSMKSKVPSQYKDAKQAIGSRFVSGKDGVVQAKAGAGVGKVTRAQQEKRNRSAKARKGSSKGGVGLSAANIHWAIMGTGERSRDSIGGFLSESGGNPTTGRMPPIMPNVIKDGFNASSSQVMNAIKTEIKAGIEAEAKK